MTQNLFFLLDALLQLASPSEETDVFLAWFAVIWMGLIVLGLFGVFRKARQPGWACLVPIYSELTLLKVSGLKWWWLFLLLIPGFGGLVQLAVFVYLVGRFGKSLGHYLGVVFLAPVFLPLLGFGPAEYRPPFESKRTRST